MYTHHIDEKQIVLWIAWINRIGFWETAPVLHTVLLRMARTAHSYIVTFFWPMLLGWTVDRVRMLLWRVCLRGNDTVYGWPSLLQRMPGQVCTGGCFWLRTGKSIPKDIYRVRVWPSESWIIDLRLYETFLITEIRIHKSLLACITGNVS